MKPNPRMSYPSRIQKAVGCVRSQLQKDKDTSLQLAIILGSGLGQCAEFLNAKRSMPFSSIPGFPVTSVEGHVGELVFGRLGDSMICCLQGRVHYHEGYSMDEVTFPIRVLGSLGIKTLILTNSVGGLHRHLRRGDLMLIRDHVGTFVPNPLIGANLEVFGPRFPDMSVCYSHQLRRLAKRCARKMKLQIREGVYIAVTGPSYETPAEVRMFRKLGADVVGMSTVPEVTAARHMGIECLGISCITNLAAGVSKGPLSHDEVISVGTKVRPALTGLLARLAKAILKSDTQ